MRRPGERPLVTLPVLERRRTELERCVFCPKLCRSACPVSNAEPTETLIPWGKMSTSYFAARGDVPLEPSTTEPAWACTGCLACSAMCEHGNDVAGTLLEARSAFVSHGSAPAAALRVIANHARREADAREAARGLGGAGPETLLVGCSYLLRAPGEARAAVRAASALLGRAPRVLGGCCGLPLLMAGDRTGFARAARRLMGEIAGAPLVVVDPGCALALRRRYPEVGVPTPALELLVERGAREVARLRPRGGPPVRYHDPCALGRGLGAYDAPREILARVLGREAGELDGARERGRCSGAGGLLPVTMPEVSRAIAEARVRGVGERVVTACASSLARFRSVGQDAADVVTYLAQGLGEWRE